MNTVFGRIYLMPMSLHSRRLIFYWMYFCTSLLFIFGATLWFKNHFYLVEGCKEGDEKCQRDEHVSEGWRMRQAFAARCVTLTLVGIGTAFFSVSLVREMESRLVHYDFCPFLLLTGGLLQLFQELVWQMFWQYPVFLEDFSSNLFTCIPSALFVLIFAADKHFKLSQQ